MMKKEEKRSCLEISWFYLSPVRDLKFKSRCLCTYSLPIFAAERRIYWNIFYFGSSTKKMAILYYRNDGNNNILRKLDLLFLANIIPSYEYVWRCGKNLPKIFDIVYLLRQLYCVICWYLCVLAVWKYLFYLGKYSSSTYIFSLVQMLKPHWCEYIVCSNSVS